MNNPQGLPREVVQVIGSMSGRPFLAGLDGSGDRRRPCVTIHASCSSMSPSEARSLSAKARTLAPGHRWQVKRHSPRTLARARSLEAFVSPFAHQDIIFDPTGVFERAGVLVSLARAIRAGCGDSVEQLLWHGRTSTLFVVLDEGDAPADSAHRRAFVRRVETAIQAALAATAIGHETPVRRIRVGFRQPPVATTPVDAKSAPVAPGQGERLKQKVYTAFLAATVGLGSLAAARAQDSAVSALNGELAIMGGSRDGETTFAVEGAIVTPLGDDFGARWDGLVGSVGGELMLGGAGHLFWRDADVGLVGLAAGYLYSEAGTATTATEQIGVIAGQAEGYLEDVTLTGMVGYQFGNGADDDGLLGRVDLEWYVHDDLMLAIGAESNPEHDLLGRVGVEYRPGIEALPGLSVFADATFGDNGYARAFAGIRLYFGPSTTLKQKHRRDTFRSHLLPTRMIDGIASDTGFAYGD